MRPQDDRHVGQEVLLRSGHNRPVRHPSAHCYNPVLVVLQLSFYIMSQVTHAGTQDEMLSHARASELIDRLQ